MHPNQNPSTSFIVSSSNEQTSGGKKTNLWEGTSGAVGAGLGRQWRKLKGKNQKGGRSKIVKLKINTEKHRHIPNVGRSVQVIMQMKREGLRVEVSYKWKCPKELSMSVWGSLLEND